MDMQEQHLGYREAIRKYWKTTTSSEEDKYLKTLRTWKCKYLEEGAKGFMKEKRGKACKTKGTQKGRPPKLDKKFEEELIAENQQLRMEIEYLKKLSALVLADERKNGKRR